MFCWTAPVNIQSQSAENISDYWTVDVWVLQYQMLLLWMILALCDQLRCNFYGLRIAILHSVHFQSSLMAENRIASRSRRRLLIKRVEKAPWGKIMADKGQRSKIMRGSDNVCGVWKEQWIRSVSNENDAKILWSAMRENRWPWRILDLRWTGNGYWPMILKAWVAETTEVGLGGCQYEPFSYLSFLTQDAPNSKENLTRPASKRMSKSSKSFLGAVWMECDNGANHDESMTFEELKKW